MTHGTNREPICGWEDYKGLELKFKEGRERDIIMMVPFAAEPKQNHNASIFFIFIKFQYNENVQNTIVVNYVGYVHSFT